MDSTRRNKFQVYSFCLFYSFPMCTIDWNSDNSSCCNSEKQCFSSTVDYFWIVDTGTMDLSSICGLKIRNHSKDHLRFSLVYRVRYRAWLLIKRSPWFWADHSNFLESSKHGASWIQVPISLPDSLIWELEQLWTAWSLRSRRRLMDCCNRSRTGSPVLYLFLFKLELQFQPLKDTRKNHSILYHDHSHRQFCLSKEL